MPQARQTVLPAIEQKGGLRAMTRRRMIDIAGGAGLAASALAGIAMTGVFAGTF